MHFVSKNKTAKFVNFEPSENNETKISEIMSGNSLTGDRHNGSLDSKSSAKIKAKFIYFYEEKLK